MRDKGTAKMKNLFLSVCDKRMSDLNLSDAEKQKFLFMKYGEEPVKVGQITTFGLYYSYKDLIINRIKQLVVYDDYDEDRDTSINPRQNVQDGLWFQADLVRLLHRQLYLDHHLGGEPAPHFGIMDTLCACVWAGPYFLFDEETITKLIDLAIDLFICSERPYNFLDREKCDAICKAAKYFKLEYSIDYCVSDGRLILYEHAQKAIHLGFESLVKKVGGKYVLTALFQNLERFYNHKFDRYVIHRNKDTTGTKADYKPIPYRYLFQLCLKHLAAPSATPDPKLIDRLVRDSQKYIKLLQIYNNNAYSDIMIEAGVLPAYLWENMYFETLCIPPQYAPKFIKLIIDELYIKPVPKPCNPTKSLIKFKYG